MHLWEQGGGPWLAVPCISTSSDFLYWSLLHKEAVEEEESHVCLWRKVKHLQCSEGFTVKSYFGDVLFIRPAREASMTDPLITFLLTLRIWIVEVMAPTAGQRPVTLSQ